MSRPETIDGRRQALREAFPKWTPTTLHGRLDSSARLYGSRPLVVTDDVILTYRDVAFESQCLAADCASWGSNEVTASGWSWPTIPSSQR